MKKTLTIMMTAATALFGLSSCNDSDSNNSSSSVAPISATDFANGDMYYELSDESTGAVFTLKGSGSSEGVNPNSASVTLTLRTETEVECIANGVAYSVSGATAILGGIQWASISPQQLGVVCTIWGLEPKDKGASTDSISLGNTSFSIAISGGRASLKTNLDPDAGVQYPEGSAEEKTCTVTVKKAATPETPDESGDSGVTPGAQG